MRSIEDINDQFDCEDRHCGGMHDLDCISCGQDGSASGYNELGRFYDEHFAVKGGGLAWRSAALNFCANVTMKYQTNSERTMRLNSALDKNLALRSIK